MRFLLAAMSAVLILPVHAQDEEEEKKAPKDYKSFLGKAPPELVSDAPNWFNGAKDAPKLEKLRGRVVWLEFSFIDNPMCAAMKPRFAKWHKELAAKGLTILEVNNGVDAKKKVEKSVAQHEVKYPLLWDKGSTNCKAYGIKKYPTAYLIGADGVVAWEGNPDAKDPELEKLLAKELERVKPAEPPKQP